MATWDYILVDEESGYYCCAICDCYMDNSLCADEHVKGRRHRRGVYRYGASITPHGPQEYYCDLCNCWIYSTANILQHMKGQRHQESLDEAPADENKGVDPYHFIVIEGEAKHYCYLCNCQLTDDSKVYMHVDSEEHKNAVEKYGFDIISSDFKWLECILCQCTISTYEDVYEHITGDEHTEALERESEFE